MNSRYILEKYIALLKKGFCSDCNELNCIDNNPMKKIIDCIEEILRENEKLKYQLTYANIVHNQFQIEKKEKRYYQSKINKAIEYLEKEYLINTKELKEILKGDNNE